MITALALLLSASNCFASEWFLYWADEFNTLDTNNWAYEEGFIRNEELQYYTDRPANVRVESGMLILEAHKETVTNDRYSLDYLGSDAWKYHREYSSYTSGSLKTKIYFTYGRIEIRAKLPYGDGVWPAFWTTGDRQGGVIRWPECGEIDIMEYLGRDIDNIHATVHYADDLGVHSSSGTSYTLKNPSDGFHVYGVEWDSENIQFYIDDEVYNTFYISNLSPGDSFRKPHILRLNFALGGWGGTVDDTILPQQYLIDYVRVYHKQEDTKRIIRSFLTLLLSIGGKDENSTSTAHRATVN